MTKPTTQWYSPAPKAPRAEPLVRAANVQVGKTYRLQNAPDTFTVLALDTVYGKTTVSAYRKAFVVDADGFYYVRWIYASSGYIESKGA